MIEGLFIPLLHESISLGFPPLPPKPEAVQPVEGEITQYKGDVVEHPPAFTTEPGFEVFEILIGMLVQAGLVAIVKFGIGGVFIKIGPIVVTAGGKQGFVIVIVATNEFGIDPVPVGVLPQEVLL